MVIAVLLLMIYCVVEVTQADPLQVRLMPKWLWVFTIVLLPGVGALAWLVLGRPISDSGNGGGGGRGPGPMAPDDDPEFLRSLHR
jgi:hypothetical protein